MGKSVIMRTETMEGQKTMKVVFKDAKNLNEALDALDYQKIMEKIDKAKNAVHI